jgi:hypothetical protein
MVRQACPELAEGLTTNGLARDAVSGIPFSSFVVPVAIGMDDSEPKAKNLTVGAQRAVPLPSP